MDRLFHLLRTSERFSYFGEPVSQLEHALQAAHFAREAGADEELTAAALLHDVGHFVDDGAEQMEELGALHHEEIGGRYLAARGFTARVVELVRGHVDAKRYLAHQSDVYRERLSPASRRTLALQGGPMTADEARRFEADPLFREKILLRKIDELAKRTDLRVASLDSLRPLVARVRT